MIAIHRPPRERGVAHQTTFKSLAGKQPGQQPHGGAGIAAVDFGCRRREDTLFAVNNDYVRLGLVDLDSQRAQCVDRVHAVFAGKKSMQRAYPVGERGNDRGPMRNALVARDSDFRFDARRSFYAQFHRVNLVTLAKLSAHAHSHVQHRI